KNKWTSEHSHYSSTSFTVDDFLRLYEPINQDLAQSIRDKDLEAVQIEMGIIAKELAIGYVEDGVSSTERLVAISSKNKSDMSLPISMAKEQNIEMIKKQTEDIRSIVALQKEFINVKTKELSLKSKTLSAFYQEKASQSLASIDGTIKFIAKLEKSIHTLDIFTGKGVQIIQLSEGSGAVDDEKITFYQRKLFLDEEFFYNLSSGGADYSSLRAFKDALQDDINIIKNMLPSEKSVVLMQYRRNEKAHYSEYANGNTSLEDIMFKAWEQAQYRKQFLFIRNGGNVYAVFSDDIQGGDRLFPTESEISSIFKKNGSSQFNGIEVDKYLNFKDLANKKARDKMDDTSLYYKRLLVLLYGLHDRDKNIFGEVGNEDWFSLDFQQQKFNFIHDDEDALDFNSKSLAEFVKEKNSSLQIGSRVIADWRYVMNEDNAKGMFSNPTYNEPNQIYNPIYTLEPHIVEQVEGKLCCYVLCSHENSYQGIKDKRIKVELDLSDNIFVIDNIRAKEIEFYLNSRKHRSQYARFAIMLVGVRDLLKREEEEARENVEYLLNHIKSALPKLDESYISEKLFESISFWRIKNRAEKLPDLTISENSKVLKEIADIFFNKTVNNKVDKLKEYCEINVENPISFSTDNKDKYFIYSEVKESEHIPFGNYEIYPFVQRTTLKLLKKGFVEIETAQIKSGFVNMNEEILYEYKKYEVDRELRDLDNRYIESFEKLKENVVQSSKMFNLIINNGENEHILSSMFQDKCDKQRASRKRHILDYNISFLVGMYFVDRGRNHYHTNKYISVITQNTNIDMLIARYGNDELYNECLVWIEKNYRNSSSTLATLKEIRAKKSNVFSVGKESEYFTNTYSITRAKLDFECALINKKRYRDYKILTSVNKEESHINYDEYVKDFRDNSDKEKYTFQKII
ncbi:MAG: hypothetical protein QG567_1723, partial [Campylobacterota bacterium]|nr:hypothetical protein [Campylobacterota bacterium]